MTTRMNHVEANWQPVDSRQHLTSADRSLVTRLGEALTAGDRLHLELPALLHLMRDHQGGQPRAAALGSGASPQAWCWNHERSVAECHKADLFCVGETINDHSDPTGEAGVDHDKAAEDARQIRRHIEAAVRALDAADNIANGYPFQAAKPAELEPTPGEDWCTSCFKDSHYLEPIALKADGSRKYAGLCRWCGEFKAANKFEPPTSLLHARHRGERITEAMVALVRAEWKRLNPESKKRTKGGKKRRKTEEPDAASSAA